MSLALTVIDQLNDQTPTSHKPVLAGFLPAATTTKGWQVSVCRLTRLISISGCISDKM